MILLLDDMLPSLAIRVGVRSAIFTQRVAGIRDNAPFFTGTGKDRYQWITMLSLAGLGVESDDNSGDDSDSSTSSGARCEGTLEDLGPDL